MTFFGRVLQKFFEPRPGATSNRDVYPRRKFDERRYYKNKIKEHYGLERTKEERRNSPERRKKWKRVSRWCSVMDTQGYLKGYHVE